MRRLVSKYQKLLENTNLRNAIKILYVQSDIYKIFLDSIVLRYHTLFHKTAKINFKFALDLYTFTLYSEKAVLKIPWPEHLKGGFS